MLIHVDAPSVVPGILLRRKNRFVVEIVLEHDEREILAHLNNTGRLEQYLVAGKKVHVYSLSKPRKTTHRLFSVEEDSDSRKSAIVDTSYQMKIFEHLIARKYLPHFASYRIERRNVKIGHSLLDYLLVSEKKVKKHLYLEIKSAVYRRDGFAMYPDCPSPRGHKHVRELISLARHKIRTAILFIAALPNVRAFRPFKEADPKMASLLQEARQVGVELMALSFHHDPSKNAIVIEDFVLPVVLD